MNNKTSCLYQVIDYVASEQFDKLNLLYVDQIILIQLARYSGPKSYGIKPSQETLSKKVHLSVRNLSRRIKILEKAGLLHRKKIGRSYEYYFLFLSTDVQQNIGQQCPLSIADICSDIEQHRTPLSAHTGHPCPPNEELNDKNIISTSTKGGRNEIEQPLKSLGEKLKIASDKLKNKRIKKEPLEKPFDELIESEPIPLLEEFVP